METVITYRDKQGFDTHVLVGYRALTFVQDRVTQLMVTEYPMVSPENWRNDVTNETGIVETIYDKSDVFMYELIKRVSRCDRYKFWNGLTFLVDASIIPQTYAVPRVPFFEFYPSDSGPETPNHWAAYIVDDKFYSVVNRKKVNIGTIVSQERVSSAFDDFGFTPLYDKHTGDIGALYKSVGGIFTYLHEWNLVGVEYTMETIDL